MKDPLYLKALKSPFNPHSSKLSFDRKKYVLVILEKRIKSVLVDRVTGFVQKYTNGQDSNLESGTIFKGEGEKEGVKVIFKNRGLTLKASDGFFYAFVHKKDIICDWSNKCSDLKNT